jgi:hypothetical protein
MRIYSLDELKQERPTGDQILLYGEANVGKSVTTIQTAPDPIHYLMVEPKDVRKMIIASGRDVKIDFGFYEGFQALLEHVLDPKHFPGQTIVLDSLTHLIGIHLSAELEDESYDALEKKYKKEGGKIDKPMVMRSKMSEEAYGALAREMLRLTQALAKLSQLGKTVVCLARLEQNPKWNRDLQAAPAFKGKEYARHFAGFFDFIGLVEPRVDKNGDNIYPPLVSFQDDGSFVSRWSGIMPEGGVRHKPLHIEKILKVSHGESTGSKPKNTKSSESKEAVNEKTE